MINLWRLRRSSDDIRRHATSSTDMTFNVPAAEVQSFDEVSRTLNGKSHDDTTPSCEYRHIGPSSVF
ncbi:hypothetical protein MKZ38_000448 [Zalerion maritima]|uniref:Uncharacterized protein n=1 Tax=Zalerion maritima TaxID=339359 RepID=A0AAD5RZH7_9PEZI|nr:hypothetical protein MKZ38_000448 [Zalerion maritima]